VSNKYLQTGRQEASEATIELLKTIEHPIGKQAEIMVDMCSYAATGNVLKIQTMLHHCSDHAPKPKSDEKTDNAEESETTEDQAGAEAEKKEKKDETPADMTYQAFAVIGIALVAMGEDVGADMSLRQFNHLVRLLKATILTLAGRTDLALRLSTQMTYGDPVVRKAVPLALALVSASNPQLPILDSLSRYSHDNDLDVAVNAILAMGLVGAGTNNARLAQMLRSLAGYYAKEANCLFMVRVAQVSLRLVCAAVFRDES
jgi:26S proteasome regulatory subunit N1